MASYVWDQGVDGEYVLRPKTPKDRQRENVLRNVAKRRGYSISRNRVRDPLALGYGEYTVAPLPENPARVASMSGLRTLEDVLAALNTMLADVVRHDMQDAVRAAVDGEDLL